MIQIINQLKKKSKFTIRAQGMSMYPILIPSDTLYFIKSSFHKVNIGDIILVRKKSGVFIHTVIYKTSIYIITKGFNNLISDGKSFPRNIIAKMIRIKRQGKILDQDLLYLFQSTLYFREIVKVNNLFKKERINFVFLKGLPVHLFYEKEHPRRVYADSDILIEKKYLVKVEDIFKRLSYQPLEKKTGFFQKISHQYPTQTSYVKIINKIPIIFDIHYDAVFMFDKTGKIGSLDPENLINHFTTSLLTNQTEISIDSQKFPILLPSSLIIFLSLHFFQHNFRGIFRLDLINKIIMRYQGQELWDRMSDIVIKYDLENYVFPTMLYLQKYYNTFIPKKFLKGITPDSGKLYYIQNYMRMANIFDEDTSGKIGIERFKNLFILSPLPLYKKLGVIYDINLLLIGIEKIYHITIRKIKHIW